MKNEATYIQEWLAFHLHSGVSHFHLYLNEDDEGTAMALKPFIDVRMSMRCCAPYKSLDLSVGRSAHCRPSNDQNVVSDVC